MLRHVLLSVSTLSRCFHTDTLPPQFHRYRRPGLAYHSRKHSLSQVCSAFSLKGSKSVYIVGVSASFTDSLVYFTEIQLLDSVSLDKNKMLPERSQYSYQLKNYLENEEGLTNRTCFVYFSNSRKKLQKTINKMKTKYQKGKTLLIREVNPNAFKFKKPEE